MPSHTPAERAKNRTEQPIASCPAGQHFDRELGRCVPDKLQTDAPLQTGKPEPIAPKPPQDIPTPKIIRNQDTGKITGVTLPDGRQFLVGGGITEKDIIALAEGGAPAPTPQGAEEGTEALFKEKLKGFTAEQQDKALELFERFQGNELTPEILATLDPGTINAYQVIASGIGGSAGAIGLRLAIGGAVGGPVGFAIAGIGIAVGSLANVKGQLKGIVKGKGALLIEFDQTMNDGINLVNGGFPTQGVMIYNDAKQEIFKLREELLITESRHLAKLTGVDATKQLLRINGWIKITLPGSEDRMRNALLNPDPTRVVETTPISFEDQI